MDGIRVRCTRGHSVGLGGPKSSFRHGETYTFDEAEWKAVDQTAFERLDEAGGAGDGDARVAADGPTGR